jgi:hypothetical protein
MRPRPGTVFLADCPARLAIEIIASKWTPAIDQRCYDRFPVAPRAARAR